MEKIKCTIERITFQNPENGYSVLQATIKGYRDEQTLVGIFHEVTVGAVLTVEGSWRVDKRYGRQFAVESWTEELPATVIGIEKYLGSGLVKGIGPKFAKQIVSHFGLETFEVIENDIDRLLEVPNIGKGRVAKIKESWEKQKDVKEEAEGREGYYGVPAGTRCQFHLRCKDLQAVWQGQHREGAGQSLLSG